MAQTIELLASAIAVLSVATCLVVVPSERWRGFWAVPAAASRTASCRTTAAPAAAPLQLGPYALLDKIAEGAMGEVFRARHVGSGHVRALKLLSRAASERQRAQFDNEARLGARLDHPNAVAVHDHGQARDGTRYLAMDLLSGISLEELVERDGPQPSARVIPILIQVAEALAAMHDQGLVHRDVKPSNILICPVYDEVDGDVRDVAKLVDFGLVKDVSEPSPSEHSDELVVGTPLYISPEAITTPAAIDGRSDLYALGAVAHYLLSGTPVFTGRSVVEVCGHHLLTPPEPLSQLVGWVIGSDLEKLVLDCLAKDPAARPATGRQLAWRLARCADAV